MATFTLHLVQEIVGEINFYYLKVDGKIQYTEFEKLFLEEGNSDKEIDQLQTRMQLISQNKRLPNTQLKKIGNKEYELKTKHIRVYFFLSKNCGYVIVYAAKKDPKPKRQNQQIAKFRNIKKKYLDQLNK